MTFFLDADICIYYLKGQPAVVEAITKLSPSKVKIPAIVQGELIDGALGSKRLKENLKIVETFCEPFDVVLFCRDCALYYGRLRHDLRLKGTMIGSNDLIIASIALNHNGTLMTHNTNEFSRVPSLKIFDPIE